MLLAPRKENIITMEKKWKSNNWIIIKQFKYKRMMYSKKINPQIFQI